MTGKWETLPKATDYIDVESLYDIDEIDQILFKCAQRITMSQEPLGEPFESIIRKNLWDLYEE